MAKKLKISQAIVLEQYRVALENVEKQSEIANEMKKLNYNTEKIIVGKAILEEARTAYSLKQIRNDKKLAAYANFSNKKEQLENIFIIHRKKAKIIFRNDALTADKLAISRIFPTTYIKWMQIVKKFYSIALENSDIQSKLAKLKVTSDELIAANTSIEAIETARAEYLKEKGEAQDATTNKNMAFDKINDWMSEFYAVAKIGLANSPQLLEVLGKMVRS